MPAPGLAAAITGKTTRFLVSTAANICRTDMPMKERKGAFVRRAETKCGGRDRIAGGRFDCCLQVVEPHCGGVQTSGGHHETCLRTELCRLNRGNKLSILPLLWHWVSVPGGTKTFIFEHGIKMEACARVV